MTVLWRPRCMILVRLHLLVRGLPFDNRGMDEGGTNIDLLQRALRMIPRQVSIPTPRGQDQER